MAFQRVGSHNKLCITKAYQLQKYHKIGGLFRLDVFKKKPQFTSVITKSDHYHVFMDSILYVICSDVRGADPGSRTCFLLYKPIATHSVSDTLLS